MRIIIFGFTGSGKSYQLSEMQKSNQFAGHQFIDLDNYVFEKYKTDEMSLKELIDSRGVDWFRSSEVFCFKELLGSSDDIIISLGGGSVTSDFLEVSFENIYGVYIKESFQTCWERIKSDRKRLIVDLGQQKCEELYGKRKELFERLESKCLKL